MLFGEGLVLLCEYYVIGNDRLTLELQFLFLPHQDVILFFEIGPPSVFRFMLQMHIMLLGDIEQDRPADGVEGDLSIVVFPRRLVRKRQRDF